MAEMLATYRGKSRGLFASPATPTNNSRQSRQPPTHHPTHTNNDTTIDCNTNTTTQAQKKHSYFSFVPNDNTRYAPSPAACASVPAAAYRRAAPSCPQPAAASFHAAAAVVAAAEADLAAAPAPNTTSMNFKRQRTETAGGNKGMTKRKYHQACTMDTPTAVAASINTRVLQTQYT